MKIYTGSGDRGMTSLFSGERVKKSYERVEAYGDVDELSSVLGALAATLPDDNIAMVKEIQNIQSDLFHLGAWLATTPDSPSLSKIEKISPAKTKHLESAIDRLQKLLPPLQVFILPGGHLSAALAHIARTVCRRAERHVVILREEYITDEVTKQFEAVLSYLNRLSDYLFVLARYCNLIREVNDIPWRK
jgi:cob(I)alamin adenosyltransferase